MRGTPSFFFNFFVLMEFFINFAVEFQKVIKSYSEMQMRRVRSLLILCLLALLPMMGVEAATVLSYVGALAGPADGDGKRVLHGVVTD